MFLCFLVFPTFIAFIFIHIGILYNTIFSTTVSVTFARASGIAIDNHNTSWLTVTGIIRSDLRAC